MLINPATRTSLGLAETDGPSFAHLHLTDLAAITTIAESWIGPSSTTGVYFKGGKVGIGTTGPGAKLDVLDSTASGVVVVSNFKSASVGLGEIEISNSTNTNRLHWGTGGSTGVAGGDITPSTAYLTSDGGATRTLIRNDNASGVIDFSTGGTTSANVRMRIDNQGNVGIGTTNPLTLTEFQGGLTTVGAVLTLSSKETSTVANDVLGRINFRAALDGSGTDAILTGASIAAIAEGTFSASNNATKLSFQTGASEVATEKMSLSSVGALVVTGTITGLSFTGGTPNGGTAAAWKPGVLVTGQIGLVVLSTQYLEVDVNGTLIKLATI